MRINNRTQEFYATVESMLSRLPLGETYRLVQPTKPSTQFYQIAMGIGQLDYQTNTKLSHLTELVKQNSLLDDKLPEINQLTQVIKMDIAKMSDQISMLSKAFKEKKLNFAIPSSSYNNRQALESSNNIISYLQNKMVHTSNEFKDVLELRTKIMRQQKSRREQYGSIHTASNLETASATPNSVASTNSSPHLFTSKIISKIGNIHSRPNSAPPPINRINQNTATAATSYTPGPQQQQQQLNTYPNSYISTSSQSPDPNLIKPIPVHSNTTPPQSSINNTSSYRTSSPLIPQDRSSSQPPQPSYLQSPPNSSSLNQNDINMGISNPSTGHSSALLNPFPITSSSSNSPYITPAGRKPNQGIALSNSVNYGPEQRRNIRNAMSESPSDESLVISMDSMMDDNNGKVKMGGGKAYHGRQQQQMYEAYSHDYLDSRSTAIDSIESTIAELGQIYQNFTQILAGQRETVQRIDDNIADVEMNVTGAQNYLMKYYKSISSNRWLIIKVLGVVLFFFFIFVVFMK